MVCQIHITLNKTGVVATIQDDVLQPAYFYRLRAEGDFSQTKGMVLEFRFLLTLPEDMVYITPVFLFESTIRHS